MIIPSMISNIKKAIAPLGVNDLSNASSAVVFFGSGGLIISI